MTVSQFIQSELFLSAQKELQQNEIYFAAAPSLIFNF